MLCPVVQPTAEYLKPALQLWDHRASPLRVYGFLRSLPLRRYFNEVGRLTTRLDGQGILYTISDTDAVQQWVV